MQAKPAAPPAPRNPLATLARRRHAGAHGPQGGAVRQRARRALQRELQALPGR